MPACNSHTCLAEPDHIHIWACRNNLHLNGTASSMIELIVSADDSLFHRHAYRTFCD